MKIKPVFLTLALVLSNNVFAVNQCDKLAADPNNKDNPQGVQGVDLDRMQIQPTITACLKELANAPNNPRFQYQLARAYNRNENYIDTVKWSKKAAEQGYAPTQLYLGIAYEHGHVVQKNLTV